MINSMGMPPSMLRTIAMGNPTIRRVEFDKETNDRICELYADKRLAVSYSRDKPDTIQIFDAAAPYDREITNVPYNEFSERVYGDDAQMESVMFKMRYG